MSFRHLATTSVLAIHLLTLMVQAEEGLSPKKGLCITPNAFKAIKSLKATWCYNWGYTRPDELDKDVEYVPMVWGWGHDSAKVVDQLTQDYKDGKIKVVLGFNEPDGKFDQGGCPMSVEAALDAWPELMKIGARLGSPSPVHPTGEWMQQFMSEVEKRNLRVDFITVHWYANPSASGLMSHLSAVYKLYKRPIWITEFAPTDWGANDKRPSYIKPPMVARFLNDLIPAMEQAPFLERYSWFSAPPSEAHMGSAALFNEDGTLTECGQIYATNAAELTARLAERKAKAAAEAAAQSTK